MKKHSTKIHSLIYTLCILCFHFSSNGQLSVTYQINTTQGVNPISPYIYGINGQDYPKATAIRQGGNRLTGYNWETNASHAGEDYYNNNDDYLPWIMGIQPPLNDSAGTVLTGFVDAANTNGQYTLTTLPMAGYVSADKDGEVYVGETAPSVRWKEVVNEKSSPLSLSPDVNDDYVYIDEEINYLIQKYGNAQSLTGVNGYSLDNEPALWPSTHPRIHPNQPTINEIMTRSVELASTIKDMDINADVFGPALYGFGAYYDFQTAPDWSGFSSTYDWFISVYLDLFNIASQFEGHRLLDVLDVHWYPEPGGVYAGDTSQFVASERMQCVRSLWDSTYIENSWIGQYFSPVAMIPHLRHSINQYYPGTKIAITEYDYAGFNHISGGIAQVEALGIFGREGVYMATKWNEVEQFSAVGYDLYLDYDGAGGTFGDMSVFSSSSDIENSSIYSAYDSNNSDELHFIITNKNATSTIQANINVNSNENYSVAEIFALQRSSPTINQLPDVAVSSNMLTLSIPALSAYHVVLKGLTSATDIALDPSGITLYPNPTQGIFTIAGDLELYDMDLIDSQGMIYQNLNTTAPSLSIDISNLPNGMYFIRTRHMDQANYGYLGLEKIIKSN